MQVHGNVPYLTILMIDHDVMRLNISMHYSHAVTEIQSLHSNTKNRTMLVLDR